MELEQLERYLTAHTVIYGTDPGVADAFDCGVPGLPLVDVGGKMGVSQATHARPPAMEADR